MESHDGPEYVVQREMISSYFSPPNPEQHLL